MAIKRRVFAAGVTLLTAGVIGHLVQNSEQFYAKVTAPKKKVVVHQAQPAVVANSGLDGANVTTLAAQPSNPNATPAPIAIGALPVLPSDFDAPASLYPVSADLPLRVAALDTSYQTPRIDGLAYNQYGLKCATDLHASPVAAGMVSLELTAACYPHTQVAVFHETLHFAMRTDAVGTMRVDVPAFSTEATFVVQFGDGTITTAVANVPLAKDYDRVGLQWSGQSEMRIHAHEFGAEYGAPGHVWAEAPSAPSAGDQGAGGFLTVLGDQDLPIPQMAEVYSYPRAAGRTDGVVRLSIEAEVTATNCEREIMAETLQPGLDGRIKSAELTLFMPDCKAKGEFLVLKNVLQDMKIARN